jgi:hypothetical protein
MASAPPASVRFLRVQCSNPLSLHIVDLPLLPVGRLVVLGAGAATAGRVLSPAAPNRRQPASPGTPGDTSLVMTGDVLVAIDDLGVAFSSLRTVERVLASCRHREVVLTLARLAPSAAPHPPLFSIVDSVQHPPAATHTDAGVPLYNPALHVVEPLAVSLSHLHGVVRSGPAGLVLNAVSVPVACMRTVADGPPAAPHPKAHPACFTLSTQYTTHLEGGGGGGGAGSSAAGPPLTAAAHDSPDLVDVVVSCRSALVVPRWQYVCTVALLCSGSSDVYNAAVADLARSTAQLAALVHGFVGPQLACLSPGGTGTGTGAGAGTGAAAAAAAAASDRPAFASPGGGGRGWGGLSSPSSPFLQSTLRFAASAGTPRSGLGSVAEAGGSKPPSPLLVARPAAAALVGLTPPPALPAISPVGKLRPAPRTVSSLTEVWAPAFSHACLWACAWVLHVGLGAV